MLAVQEWHMASEGLDTLSICPRCSSKDLHVLSTGARTQCFGNPQRAVRYFCSQCQTIHNQVAAAPLPPCPLPAEVLNSLRKIPEGSLPLLSRPVDFDTVEQTARSQELDKSPGADEFPRELYKYCVQPLLVLLWRAINAYLRGDIPSVCAHEWLGAIASSIPK
jgi:hypothetical protein